MHRPPLESTAGMQRWRRVGMRAYFPTWAHPLTVIVLTPGLSASIVLWCEEGEAAKDGVLDG
jgi:hypothetical protein